MSENELTKDDFDNFQEKTKEEKMDTLRALHQKLDDGEDLQGLLQEISLEGEMTVRVLDEDGEEKQVEKEKFEN